MKWCVDCFYKDICKHFEKSNSPHKPYGYCNHFQDKDAILTFPVPLGAPLWVIEDEKVWKGKLEKVSVSATNDTWFEVTMPSEMPDVTAIEYRLDDFGKIVFENEKEAENALKKMKEESERLE